MLQADLIGVARESPSVIEAAARHHDEMLLIRNNGGEIMILLGLLDDLSLLLS